MNEKGFIASSLLYGMLALFLVLMVSTIYVLGNDKLNMDKLKEKALNDIKCNYKVGNECYVKKEVKQNSCSQGWYEDEGFCYYK